MEVTLVYYLRFQIFRPLQYWIVWCLICRGSGYPFFVCVKRKGISLKCKLFIMPSVTWIRIGSHVSSSPEHVKTSSHSHKHTPFFHWTDLHNLLRHNVILGNQFNGISWKWLLIWWVVSGFFVACLLIQKMRALWMWIGWGIIESWNWCALQYAV